MIILKELMNQYNEPLTMTKMVIAPIPSLLCLAELLAATKKK